MKFFFQTGKNHKDAIQNKQDKVNAKVNRFAHMSLLNMYFSNFSFKFLNPNNCFQFEL